ncbi:MAG: peptide deformylase [Steroidobacteraceae bacterium]
MTCLTILEYPDPRLRTVAAPVATVDDEVRTLIADMLETMYAAKGIGLAATQVDVHRRLLVIDVSDERNEPRVFVDPEVIARDATGSHQEGCLSVPGIYEDVQRAQRIRVRALDRDGRPFELDADGLLAICIQHEIDHLDGRLFVDYLSELKRQRIRKKLDKERRHRADTAPRRSGAPSL